MRPQLDQWSLAPVSDTAQLLVTELVSNVVCHVGAPMTVRMTRGADAVRVEVEDPSAQLPEAREPDPASEGGRGLALVATLASRWGTDVHPADGKTVWFELDVD
jgi:anti-sigma regulatory factor (Ser/Thr protein kinase)